jgi:hypothetical protein
LPGDFGFPGNVLEKPGMSGITLATQTLFAELLQRSLDAEFDEKYDERGNFVRRLRRGHYYWYYQRTEHGKQREEYVGPVRDHAIDQRVKRFESIKSDFQERREMVRALVAAGLPVPDAMAGPVIEALARAGFFRLRGVLVGTVAYQCYAGSLGIRLPGAQIRTQDADFAQFWGIAQAIGESMPPILGVLREIDSTFSEVPNVNDPFVSTRFQNALGYKVEFLTPNRGSDDHQGRPARMPALGGAGAQPLRHLDYLIHQPERSVVLFKGGIPVTVPRAERYAVHKLIVSAERDNVVKAAKDTMQASTLIEALSTRRPLELAEAWEAAWKTGARWREKLEKGRARLRPEVSELVDDVRAKAAKAAERRRTRRAK